MSELRVHGVSGTRPEDMLDRPILYRVAGDDEAAFLRPRPEFNATTGPGGAKLEAYRWGSLTAGAAARAFWLLLAPFMLTNVMVWLRPPAGRRGSALVRAICRVFALSVTATFVLAMVGVSVDLVGWQCTSPGSTCGTSRSWLRFLTAGFFSTPGRRMAVTALVPVAAVGVLWLLARRTWSRYETFTGIADTDGDGLAAPTFWRGRSLVARLRGLHIAIAFATLDAVLLGAVIRSIHVHGRSGPGGWLLAGWIMAAMALLILSAVLVAICLPAMAVRDGAARWAHRFSHGAWLASVLLTAAALIYLMVLPPGLSRTSTGGLPGYGLTLPILYGAQTVLLLALGIVVFLQRRAGQFFAGLAAPVLGSMALGLAVSFSAGLTFRVADFLDRAAVPSGADPGPARATLQPPPSMAWGGLGFLVAVIAVALVGVWFLALTRPRLRRAAVPGTDRDFPGRRTDDPDRAAAIDRASAGAGTAEHVARMITGAYAPVAAAAIVATGLALAGVAPLDLVTAGTRQAAVLSFAVNLGSYLVGLVTLGLAVLGLLAYRYHEVRRSVGILWDLGTFWPRAGHPLAPPCYAERAIPELATRVTWLASDEGGAGVVLSGHSQGSVLAAATVLQLSQETRQRVALLTYGSPLRRLYCRLFPAYINPEVLEEITESLTDFMAEARWINLWRSTDPIGGPMCAPATPAGGSGAGGSGVGGSGVGGSGVGGSGSSRSGTGDTGAGDTAPAVTDRRIVDPTGFDIAPGDTVPPTIERHSGYQSTMEFAAAVTDLVDRL